MSIDFRCPQCDKLLRTPDDSAGKQAKCPQCAAILRVPTVGGASDPQPMMAQSTSPFNAPSANPFGAPPAGASQNPFSAPQTVNVSSGMSEYGDTGDRTGPPWEQRSSSATYIETLKLIAQQPTLMFSTMRTLGGFGKPLIYSAIGFVIASIVGAIYQEFLYADVGGPRVPGFGTMGLLGTIIFSLVGAIFGLVIGSFISAGILHLALMIVGGANRGYETTFRVAVYASGTTVYAQLIPFAGGLIATVWNLVLNCIGLARAHETSTGKAIAAVALVIGFFLLLVIGAIVLFGSVIYEAMRKSGGMGF